MIRYYNFLDKKPLPEGVAVNGFAHSETDPNIPAPWRWSLGRKSSILVPAGEDGYLLYFSFKPSLLPQFTRIFLNKDQVMAVALGEEEKQFQRTLAIPPDQNYEITFDTDFFNSENHPLSPSDLRPIALCFTELRVVSAKFTNVKICPMPFTRMEVNGSRRFVPCCSPWLSQEFHEMEPGADPWNGPQALGLRESILDGSYKFCRREICKTDYYPIHELHALTQDHGEFVLTERNLEAIREIEPRMPDGPTALTVLSDPRCNLACASCRPGKITSTSAEIEARIEMGERVIQAHKNNLFRLRIAGDGEPLFSPYMRKLIASINAQDFPRLKILELHSNGLLLDAKNLENLLPGSSFINRLSISIDAGSEGTYQKVRGGDWKRLIENLQWAGKERKNGRFQSLALLFVYRKENFRNMPDFVALAKKVHADEVHFSPLLRWERMAIENYAGEAVHLPGNDHYQEFMRLKSKVTSETGVKVSVV